MKSSLEIINVVLLKFLWTERFMHCQKMSLKTAILFSCNETEYTFYIGGKITLSVIPMYFSSIAGQLKL